MTKITPEHLARSAVIYIRQSSPQQVMHNLESKRRNLLCRPLGGRMRRHMHVENLPAGVMDDEEDVECPKEDRLDAEEITRPDGRCVLLQE